MTELVGESDFVDITVTTEASVTSLVTNVRVTSVKSTELSLAWDAPLTNDATDNDGDVVEVYEVRMHLELHHFSLLKLLQNLSLLIP